PEAWVKGTISGDKAVFQNGQYLGIDASTNSFVYLLSAKVVTADDGTMVYTLADDDITFNYDTETKSLTGSSLFLANNGKDNASAAAIYGNAVIQPFIETPATPQTPYDLDLSENGFNDYLRGYGWGILYFSLIPADNQGNYILPEKLSYVLYARVNGEEFPVKLYSADYQYQEEPVMEEIPYNYSDGWDIYIRDRLRTVYYYFIGPEAYGVQAVYRGGGEEHRSDIAWVNVQTIGADIQPDAATPDYPDIDPDNVGSTIKYSPIASGGTRGYFGNWQPQTYDVAMKLQDEALTGTYIQDVIVPLMRIKDISNMKVWLSSQLRLENGQNVPDLMSMDVTPTANGNFTVTLPKPYIIPAEGVYVGFSITINENTYTGTTYPIRTVEEAKETGLYVHSTRDILKWLDLSEGLNKSALIEVNVGGSKVKSNAVSPQDGESIFVRTGNDIKATVTFVNHGGAGVKSLDVEFTLNGNTTEQHIVKNLAATYGVTTQATITLPAINERGNYELKVRVTKVNDVDNEDPQAEAVIPVILMSSEPKHRPLLEEYTGTWCGWCPRGFVALEKLAKLYPDDFVCIAYHNSDPMEIMPSSDYPMPVGGFPHAWLDRGMEIDPYYGSSGSKNFGILDDLQWRAAQFGTADIEVSAKLSDDEQTVDVTTNLIFPFSDNKAKYALEYILVADGLTGPAGSDWDQTNNYAGQNYGSDMAEFQHAGSPVSGLVFNDVAVMMSQTGGIEGSVPTTVKADEPIVHAYTFNLADAVNTSGENVIQDVNKLRVVALLIDKSEGLVANANKTIVSTPVGIGTISSSRQAASVSFFDISGRQQQSLQPGVNIIRYSYADGTSRTVKVVKR
ncbi:MAG: CARDB domain-containing protein, partial [Prevotella sp.]